MVPQPARRRAGWGSPPGLVSCVTDITMSRSRQAVWVAGASREHSAGPLDSVDKNATGRSAFLLIDGLRIPCSPLYPPGYYSDI